MIFLPLAYYNSLTIFLCILQRWTSHLLKSHLLKICVPTEDKNIRNVCYQSFLYWCYKTWIEGSNNYQKICHFCVGAIFLAKVLLQNKILNYAKMSYKNGWRGTFYIKCIKKILKLRLKKKKLKGAVGRGPL